MSKYSGKQIIRAGGNLVQENLKSLDQSAFDDAMDCLSYWRGEHARPLESAYEELEAVTSKIDKHPVFSKRLKRADSIRSKLRLHKGMRLNRMQDIGGCRVVVSCCCDFTDHLEGLRPSQSSGILSFVKPRTPDCIFNGVIKRHFAAHNEVR